MQRSTWLVTATAFVLGATTVRADDAPQAPNGETPPAQAPTPPAETPPAETPPAPAPPAEAPPAGTAPAQTPPAEAPPAEAPPAEAPPAPQGTVSGKLIDNSTKEGLPAATIQIKGPGGDQTLATELDGTFTLSLAPGSYTITWTTPDYIEVTRTVVVTLDKPLVVNLGLDMIPSKAAEETIEVFDTIDTRKSSAVLAERRAAATVSDAVSAEQISRSPDSNASDAAKRMVAATIQDNRYIVVRGLGSRYSLTLLNGIPLPSPDPDMPSAPLDLFPASLITNLTVNKTFSPDLPASFAGGALGIETRTYPTKFTFKAKVGVANNTLSSFQTLNGQNGGSLDILGFDDGSRALPSSIPKYKLAGDFSLPQEQRNAQIAGFKNNWEIERGTAGPNLSLGAQVGDSLKLGTHRLGYFSSLSYGHGYSRRQAHISRVGSEDGMGGRLPADMQLDDDSGTESANLGAIASVGWTPASGHKIDVFNMYSHSGDITASRVTGMENNNSVVDRTRLQFLQRELVFTQMLGEHKVAPKAIVEWQGNVAHVAQYEPDTRDLLRTQGTDGRYGIPMAVGAAERMYGELSDTTFGAGAAVRVPLEKVKLKAGGLITRSDRTYQQRRFHFDVLGDMAYEDPNVAFSPENAGVAMAMTEVTVPKDGYVAERMVTAAYAMADVNVTKKLRAVGGARLEMAHLEVGLESKIDLMVPPEKRTTQDDVDVLPAVNLVYAVTPSSNLRAAYGMTLARPNFREISPTLYFDFVRRRAIGGNPNLLQTTIHNGDLRWETFLGDSEVLAASLFVKQFDKPIERTVEQAGDGQNVGFENGTSANTYGVELEARLSLGRVTPALREFSVGGNLSLIRSNIEVSGASRALQGQSPYVANLGLGYESNASKTRVDLLFNSFGRRIDEVGTGGAGHVYEEAFHRLDLAVSQPLPRDVRLKLSGTNLLNQRVVRTQDDVEIFAYPVGVTVVGSVEMTLE
ncbi:MAG: TonB-dependent receptor [Myxococcales bacterium]|nr:TonB-dependent receptor [Myxococcales bacterium]